MRIISTFIWISLLLLMPFAVNGQQQGQQPPPPGGQNQTRQPKVKLPKEPKNYKPTGVRFGTNLIRLGRSAFDGGYQSYDFSADIDFYRYMLEVGYGIENFDEQKPNHNYSSKGSFFRIGADANLISNPEKGNAMLLGVKYVFSNFDENLNYTASSVLFGDRPVDLNNGNISARWAEINFGMKGKVISNLQTGFYLRYKFFKQTRGETTFDHFKIPGYGLGAEDNRFGFDYYIMWRIPLKKEPVLLNEI